MVIKSQQHIEDKDKDKDKIFFSLLEREKMSAAQYKQNYGGCPCCASGKCSITKLRGGCLTCKSTGKISSNRVEPVPASKLKFRPVYSPYGNYGFEVSKQQVTQSYIPKR